MRSAPTESSEPGSEDLPAPALVHETERLRREIERLQIAASQDRGILDAILRHSPHGIIVCDASGKLILQNPAAERIWAGSATAGSVAGWGQYRAFHPDGRPFQPDDWVMARSLAQGEVIEGNEHHIERFDGTRGWLLGSAAPLYGPDGRQLGAISIFADITHLKEAEAALRRSEHRFRQILDSVQEMVFTRDTDLRITFANAAACRYYELDADALRGRTELPFCPPEITAQQRQDDYELLRTARSVERQEEPSISPRGEVRYFHTIKTPIFDARGELREIVSVSRDITERRRADCRLRANHAVARILADAEQVADAMPRVIGAIAGELEWQAAAYWSVGSDGRLGCEALWLAPGLGGPAWSDWIEVNRASRFARGHGLPGQVFATAAPQWVSDVAGDPVFSRTAPATAAGLRSGMAFPVLLGTEVLGVIEVFAAARIAPEPALLEMVTTLGAHVGQFVERARLFVEAQVRARALEEERAALATLNRIGSLLAGELDQGKLVQALTDAATAVSGARFGGFFAVRSDEPGPDLVLAAVSAVPAEALANELGAGPFPIFLPSAAAAGVLRSDDLTCEARWTAGPLQGLPGGPPSGPASVPTTSVPMRSYLAVPVLSRAGLGLGALHFSHPEPGVFTARAERIVVGIAAQAAIALDNARLYNEAQSAIAALERSNKELDQFAYVTSHDLKAPLRGIASLAEWIEEDAGPQLPGEARRHLELLRGRVRRMEGLIQGILELSRAGRVRVQPELVDVGALLAEVVDLLQPVPPARVEIAPDLPRLFAERLPLSQVFSNLISNSLKHAGRPDVTIRVRSDDDGDSWRFTIADDGRGIPAPYRERVFELFQTLEARDRVESTGIGLSIVRKVVEGRGGRVWIDDSPTGATFRFTWPKKATSAPPPKL
ncbi:MAG: PAS domain S-box protein [Polyangia bacterium]